MAIEDTTPTPAPDIPVREVAGAHDSSLRLQGTVLVHRARTWAGRTSLYIPIECLSVTRTRRFNSPILLRGMQALLVVALLGLPASIVPDEYARMFLVGYAGLLSATLVYFSYAIIRFLRRRPTVRFEALVREGIIAIECWNDKRELDGLVRRITGLQTNMEEIVPYPAKMSCQMFQMKSLRVALARALSLTLFLAVAVALFANYLNEPRIWFFLLLPWIVYPGKYLLDRLRLRSQPALFRRAVLAFEDDQLMTARGLLNGLLAAYPRYLPALVLKAQVCTLLGEFPSAFRACEALAEHEPEVAESLREEILSIENLQRRMEMEI